MNSALFVFWELLRSLKLRTWLLSALAIGLGALLLASLALITLLLEPEPAKREDRLIAVPKENLSQSDLATLHQTLLADPSVFHVRYVFGETAGQSYFEITLQPDVDPEEAQTRFRSWGVFQDVIRPQPESPGPLKALLLDPKGRWVTLGGFGLLTVAAFLALIAAIASARREFAGELLLLERSGAHPQTIRLPFAFLGLLYGLASALSVAVCAFIASLAFSLALRKFLPELSHPGAFLQIGLRGVLLGVIYTGLSSLFGLLLAPRPLQPLPLVQRYPKPRKRSRMRASSSGVSPESSGPSTPTAAAGEAKSGSRPEA